jgi:uncharacterized membrane protein
MDHSVTHPHRPGLSSVIERNMEALLKRRQKEARLRSRSQRAADRISHFAGSMSFVYLHLVLFGGWIALNKLPLPFPPFDPTLVVLAMFASVEAIFLSTFVLMNQNQMSAASEERAELDLQISLLAEHEITRVVTMLSAVCEHLEVEQPEPQELADLKRDVAPERVLDRLDEQSAVSDGEALRS